MRKMIAIGVASLFGTSVSTHAADIGTGSISDAPVVSGAVQSWAGLYVGGSGGFGKGDLTDTRSTVEIINGLVRTYVGGSSDDVSGPVYGAHIGYNLQFGHFVAGLEAGINGTNIDGCGGSCGSFIEVNTKVDSYATAVARLGYAEGSWLLYGFGGAAWATADMEAVDNYPRVDLGHFSPPQTFDIHGGHADYVGWTAGFGVEYALSDRLSLRAEYAHVDLGEESISLGSMSEAIRTQDFTATFDLSLDVVKVGASYKLYSPEREVEPLN